MKIKAVFLVLVVSVSAMANWDDKFVIPGPEANHITTTRTEIHDVRVQWCTNGATRIVQQPVTISETHLERPQGTGLEEGFYVTDKQNRRYLVKYAPGFTKDGLDRTKVVVTNAETKVVEEINLDRDPGRGTVALTDYPMSAIPNGVGVPGAGGSGPGGRNKVSEVRKITGLAKTEHWDPKTGEVFHVWHVLNDENVIFERPATPGGGTKSSPPPGKGPKREEKAEVPQVAPQPKPAPAPAPAHQN